MADVKGTKMNFFVLSLKHFKTVKKKIQDNLSVFFFKQKLNCVNFSAKMANVELFADGVLLQDLF